MIDVASARVPATMTGEIAFGHDVRSEDSPTRDTNGSSRQDVVGLSLSEDRASHQAREDRHVDDPDREHDLEESAAPEQRDDPDRHEKPRDREHDVHAAHDRGVESAEVAGRGAEQHAERESDGDGHDSDEERVARPVDEPRELVASQIVDTERVLA